MSFLVELNSTQTRANTFVHTDQSVKITSCFSFNTMRRNMLIGQKEACIIYLANQCYCKNDGIL